MQEKSNTSKADCILVVAASLFFILHTSIFVLLEESGFPKKLGAALSDLRVGKISLQFRSVKQF